MTFSPKRLALARAARKRTKQELALALGVSGSLLTHYETGHRVPPEEMVKRLALVLSFPERFFLRAETDNVSDSQRFYRRLSAVTAGDRARVEAVGQLFAELMKRLFERTGHEQPPVNIPDLHRLEPEEAAREMRRHWGLASGPIANMVELLEAAGVWVQRLDFAHRSIDAYSYWHGERPNVVLNPAKGDPYRFRFDAAHELGHLVLHRSRQAEHKELENEAHRFAAELLVPASEWRKTGPQSTYPEAYLSAKGTWNVSVAFLLYRSRAVGHLSAEEFKSAMVQYSRRGWRTGEPAADGPLPYEPAARLAKLHRELVRSGTDPSDVQAELGLPDDLWSIFWADVPGFRS